MDYEVLETEIVNRLSPFATAGVDVVKLPETEADKSRPLPTKARFTISYAGSEYQDTMSTGFSHQTENVFLVVVVESTFLRGNLGIYTLLSVLKQALVGFKPTGCNKIQAVKHHTIGTPKIERVDNMWEYQAIFKTDTVSVENFTEDLSVLLRKITLIDVPDDERNVIPNPNND